MTMNGSIRSIISYASLLIYIHFALVPYQRLVSSNNSLNIPIINLQGIENDIVQRTEENSANHKSKKLRIYTGTCDYNPLSNLENDQTLAGSYEYLLFKRKTCTKRQIAEIAGYLKPNAIVISTAPEDFVSSKNKLHCPKGWDCTDIEEELMMKDARILSSIPSLSLASSDILLVEAALKKSGGKLKVSIIELLEEDWVRFVSIALTLAAYLMIIFVTIELNICINKPMNQFSTDSPATDILKSDIKSSVPSEKPQGFSDIAQIDQNELDVLPSLINESEPFITPTKSRVIEEINEETISSEYLEPEAQLTSTSNVEAQTPEREIISQSPNTPKKLTPQDIKNAEYFRKMKEANDSVKKQREAELLRMSEEERKKHFELEQQADSHDRMKTQHYSKLGNTFVKRTTMGSPILANVGSPGRGRGRGQNGTSS